MNSGINYRENLFENAPIPDNAVEITEKPKGVKRSSRSRSRQFVLQGLYQNRVANADEAAIRAHLAETDGYGKINEEFFIALLGGILRVQKELEAAISEFLDRPLAELSPIEAAILLIGAFELIKMPETPYRVAINEAVELAKIFGGTDGHKYVNGVLDKLAAKWREIEFSAKNRRA